MSPNRVIDLRIDCSYCILQHRILTELIFGGYDVCKPAATEYPSAQWLAGRREVGGTPYDCSGPLRHRVPVEILIIA